MKRLVSIATVLVAATLAVAAFAARASLTHAASGAISISSDSDFTTCGCLTGGNGSTANPYILGAIKISGVSGDALTIDGTNLTKSFKIVNPSISSNSGYGIVLNHIDPSNSPTYVAEVYGKQSNINSNTVGVLIENSNYVTLDGAGENRNGQGIGETGAGTINKNASGAVDVESSSHVTIEGWQMSTNGPSIQPNWITLDPTVMTWAVGGVRFFGTTYSTVDHNAGNNDTNVTYSLFDSSHNTLSNNTADYPFTMNYIITDGSSYNTLNNNESSTGDFIGLMVADPLPGSWTLSTYGATHDNLIESNTIHTDGPTGNEIHNHVAPAFLGGIVVLNGTYNNTIKNNTTWGSFGSDLAWAQAVPNSGSPIAVDYYPPTEHCNVTASEGGGGVSNHNGNVWSGNTYKTIDACITQV
jgi:hypothetical protein